MAAVKNLMVRCGADFSGLTTAANKANASMASLQRSASNLGGSVSSAGNKVSSAFAGMKKAIAAAGIAVAIKQIVTGLADLTKESMNLTAQEKNLSRTMAGSKAEFTAWAKNNASAFGISEKAAIQYGNAYSNLISGFIADTSTSTKYTQQLVEASAVIASRTGRTVEDVNERIRSGLLGSTEAIEDLGINVNVALLETTNAFKSLANGRSWAQLTFQEQQQVRLFSILEQSAAKFGTSLAGGGATSLMKFSAELANLKLELGRAFEPLAETVIPALTQFVSMLGEAIRKVSAFFATLRGDAVSAGDAVETVAVASTATATGMQEATAATKEMKTATTGIDELNILSDDNGSTGSADTSAAASSSETAAPAVTGVEKATQSAGSLLKVLEDIRSYLSSKFAPSIESWRTAFSKLANPAKNAFDQIKSSVSETWNNTIAPFGSYLVNNWIPEVSNAFSETFAPIFTDVMSFALQQFGSDFEWMCQRIDAVVVDMAYPTAEFFKGVFTDAFSGIKSAWDEHGQALLTKFGEFRDKVKEIWTSLYDNIFKPVFDRIGNTVSWLWDEHLKPLWDNLMDFFGTAGEYLLTLWNSVVLPCVNWLVTVLGPVVTHVIGTIGDVVGTVFAVISDVVSGILRSIGGLLDFITGVFEGNWEKAWNGIKDFFGGIWDAMWGIVKGIVNLIIDGLNSLWGGVYSVASGIVNGIGGIAGTIGDLFGQDWHFSMPAEPPLIPKLAKGGIVYEQTLALIGEYSGARSNPEVVAPLNTLRDMLGDTNASDPRVPDLLDRILDAILGLDFNVVLRTDDRTIASSTRRGEKAMGYPILATT